jgi:fumarate reductase flavoprotein subunit
MKIIKSLIALTLVITLAACSTGSKVTKTDVLVIGGGGAGLVASVTAAEAGKNVILVEKMAAVGGNTIISATGITASDTYLHTEAGIPFTKEDHFKRTMETGKNLANPELVNILVNSSADAVQWLADLGLKLKVRSDKEPFWLVPVEGHYGSQFVGVILNKANEFKNLEIRTSSKALELLVEDGKVVGALIEGPEGQYEIKAKSVVLATGGLNNNPEMIAEYNAKYANANTEMTTAGATGDGIIMALAVNANLIDMEYFQMRPLSINGDWYNESIVNTEDVSGILVNFQGQRFVNETLAPKALASEILKTPEHSAYAVFDQRVAETPAGKKFVEKGKAFTANTIAELAALMSIDAAVLEKTINDYNEGVDPFERTVLGQVIQAPYYAVITKPSNHYTMGGIQVDANAQVIDKQGNPIEGLYAAGEVIGGLYGDGRVAGNNTLDDVVFGKIAGSNAAK